MGPETEEQIKLSKNKIHFDCSFQKVIRTLTFRGRERFNNSFYFKTLGMVWYRDIHFVSFSVYFFAIYST